LKDGVATVRMQDVVGVNALSRPFVKALRAALTAAVDAPGSRAILLCGLPHVFCSGATLEALRDLSSEALSPEELLSIPRHLLFLPLPCIAAMRGHAVGGGFSVGLCADIVVLSRENRYGANFMDLGFTPGMGMTRLLEHFMPPSLAHEMLYSGACHRGSHFDGRTGFNRVVNAADVETVARDIATEMAEKPRHALELLKHALVTPRRQKYEADVRTEILMHRVCFGNPETKRRIEENYAQ